MQSAVDMPGFPGWCRSYLARRTGVGSGRMSPAMASGGTSAPRFLREVKAGKSVRSREFIRTMGTYPSRTNTRWRYQVSMPLDGEANAVNWKIVTSPVNRNSHKGPDQGARSALVRIESITVVAIDGATSQYNVNQLLDDYINGWRQYDHVWAGSINIGKPIRTVTMSVYVEMGSEQYHDSGDGYTPPTDYSAATQCAVGYKTWVPNSTIDVRHDVYREYRPTSDAFKQWSPASSVDGGAVVTQL